MIYDVIYSLFVLIEQFAFFNKQLQEYVISLLMLGFLKATFLVLQFSYYTSVTCLMILSAILLSMLILLSILSVIRHLICGNNLNWLLNLNLIYETLWSGPGSGLLISMLESSGVIWLVNNTGAIDVKMDESAIEEKLSFKMLGLTFSSELDWSFYIISIATIVLKKTKTLICSMKFPSPEVALYLYKSIIQRHMEYCHVCALWTLGSSSKCSQLKSFLQVLL